MTGLNIIGPDIRETDKIIFCWKIGWKFGFFFDLRSESKDLEALKGDLGRLHRLLLFEHVYRVVGSAEHFDELVADGWFPFVEIIPQEYRMISDAYSDRFDFENRIKRVVEKFDRARLERIMERWWQKDLFASKRQLLGSAVRGFLRQDHDGYVACIKILLTEIDGLLRLAYARDTGESCRTTKLIDHAIRKEREPWIDDGSLLLPAHFLKYMRDIVFRSFDLSGGDVALSRRTASHGVAAAEDYNQVRALQAILTVDQLWFYSRPRSTVPAPSTPPSSP